VFVGNVSPQWQIASGKAKATLDMSWSTLRNLFRYKCDHAGVAFAEVNESYTTQTCSDCGVIGGPKRSNGLGGQAVGLWRLRRGSRSRSQRRSKHCPYRVRYAWPEVARELRPLGRGGITSSDLKPALDAPVRIRYERIW
jgi:hypothetical protein